MDLKSIKLSQGSILAPYGYNFPGLFIRLADGGPGEFLI